MATWTLDQIVRLQGAGLALLVAHRWLATQPAAGATAFDLLQALSFSDAPAVQAPAFDLLRGMVLDGGGGDRVPALVMAIARGDPLSAAVLNILRAAWALDRAEALLRSQGASAELVAEHRRKVLEGVRQLQAQHPALYGLPADRRGGAD